MKLQHPIHTRFLAIAAVLLLPGCTEPDSPEETEIQYGLGLEVPFPLPPRGPFLEGEAVVADLRGKLEQMVPKVLETCGVAFTPEQLRSSMDSDLLYASIYAVYNNCEGNISEEARRIANESKRTGTEKETYNDYLDKAWDSINRQASMLDNVSQGATVAEVEMVSKIQAQVLLYILGLDTQQRSMDHYLNVSQDEFDLANVFLGLLMAPGEATTQAILREYPWTTSSCRVPDVKEFEKHVKTKLETALELARKWDKPESAEFVTRPYGALIKVHAPTMAYAVEHGWWQVLLRIEMELDHIIAEYKTYETNILPTQEEARYLVALYWNQSRSLVIQDRLDSLTYQVEQTGLDWEENDLRARLALSLGKMDWAFSQVVCG